MPHNALQHFSQFSNTWPPDHMTNQHPIKCCCNLGTCFHNPQHPHQQPNDDLSTPAGVLTHWSWHFLCFSSFHHPPSVHLTKNCHVNVYHSTPPTTMLLT